MRRKSLRAIVAIYLAIFLVALAAVRTADYFVAYNALEKEVDLRLASEAGDVVSAGNGVDEQAMIDRIGAEQDHHNTADLYYMLVDKEGRRLAGKLRLPRLPPAGYSDLGEDANVEGVVHGRALTHRLANGGALVVVSDNDVIDSFKTLMFRVQLTGLGVTALIVIGGAVSITAAIGGRMRAMQRTVDAVIAGNLRSRIPLDGSRSEFDQQATAFNKMLDRIAELMANIRHSARDVTHELKSPLARLRAQVAALARHSEGERLGPDIADLQEQTDQILDLFSSLMRLWEIEGGHRRERFVDLDLSALATEVGEALQDVAEDEGQRFALLAPVAAPVRGDVNLLRQMLVNLVENAIRHTPSGSRIELATLVTGSSVVLTVTDDGPGIPATQHESVIRRFGRLESASASPGQGLGLTLVDAIARLHGGQLKLEDAGPGVRAVVELPRRR